MKELGFEQLSPTPMYEDNEAAIAMINASKPTVRSRHIDIQHFAIQEWKLRGDIIFHHIAGTINMSDAMTKSVRWLDSSPSPHSSRYGSPFTNVCDLLFCRYLTVSTRVTLFLHSHYISNGGECQCVSWVFRKSL